MDFTLPELPYPYNALEPYIDEKTMIIHHTKHHQGYVDNLNKTLEGVDFKFKSVEEVLKNIHKVPEGLRQTVINNGGGHFNHSFFWKIMSPKKTSPSGKLLKMLNEKFGSVDKFKEEFTNRAMSLFGCGWTFLIMDKKEGIRLKRHSFQNTPIIKGNLPILGIDLWEHAYYLKYQNRKLDYIKAWWNVVNWEKVEKNYIDSLDL